jgi:ATP adenylyltransferase
VLPYRHVAELEDLTAPEAAELMEFTQEAVRAMKRVAAPHAFNVGLNLGTVAGGSLADHLHQHVVPRWGGDANFIAVVGQTKVIPQLLSETRDLLAGAWEPDWEPTGDTVATDGAREADTGSDRPRD